MCEHKSLLSVSKNYTFFLLLLLVMYIFLELFHLFAILIVIIVEIIHCTVLMMIKAREFILHLSLELLVFLFLYLGGCSSFI